MTVSLLDLPRELVDEILSHVSQRDFKRFSRCSRACRGFFIPFVFNHIEWRTPTKAAAFRDGGLVGHLRPAVSHISMHCPGRPSELFRTIDAFQVYMDVLKLFPNIRSLWINLSVIEEIEANLIHAIFTKLSTTPAFYTLKSLNFTCKRFSSSYNLHDLSGSPGQDFFAALPEKYHQFLGPRIQMTDTVDPPPGPPGLTELVVATYLVSLTPAHEFEPRVSFLLQSSAETLTRLCIRSNIVLAVVDQAAEDQGYLFNCKGLRQVQINFGYGQWHLLRVVKDVFPDIEDLAILKQGVEDRPREIGRPHHKDETTPYESPFCHLFKGMKNLRRLRVPWLVGSPGRYEKFGSNCYLHPDDLEETINCWVSGGTGKLEKVVFAQDDTWGSYGGKNIWQSLIGFTIVRGGTGTLDIDGKHRWKVSRKLGGMAGISIQGVGQRSMDELFEVSPPRTHVSLYGKQNWLS
ncbi:hypothetical protein TWF718_008190 [Orbilia javanica]|uniref:F-box domain-containing protein n=1 Tax=Orbilia javanica TaxID=47235 RepID=A0AAN8NTT2_9PEZI